MKQGLKSPGITPKEKQALKAVSAQAKAKALEEKKQEAAAKEEAKKEQHRLAAEKDAEVYGARITFLL